MDGGLDCTLCPHSTPKKTIYFSINIFESTVKVGKSCCVCFSFFVVLFLFFMFLKATWGSSWPTFKSHVFNYFFSTSVLGCFFPVSSPILHDCFLHHFTLLSGACTSLFTSIGVCWTREGDGLWDFAILGYAPGSSDNFHQLPVVKKRKYEICLWKLKVCFGAHSWNFASSFPNFLVIRNGSKYH